MKGFLMAIGVFTCLCLIIFCAILGFEALAKIISRRKSKYVIEHRFDKPPIAKCYCIDCRFYLKLAEHSILDLERDGNCMLHAGWNVADNWFCWAATPNVAALAEKGESHER